MNDEYTALIKNQTWNFVELPPNKQGIGRKWVFRIKQNLDGSINKYKDRFVAKGFHQKHGCDYTETFSSVVKPVTVRLILTLALTHHWAIQRHWKLQQAGFEHPNKKLSMA